VHTNGWIIEDDYDAEFRYDRDPVGMVQGLTPDRVINIGTVSKSLAPTLRLGWLLCPPGLVESIADLKIRADRGSPGLDQLVLARLIETGRFDRHLRRMRTIYAGKRDALLTALKRACPRRSPDRSSSRLPRRRPASPGRQRNCHRRGSTGPRSGNLWDERQPLHQIPRATPARPRIWKPLPAGHHRRHHPGSAVAASYLYIACCLTLLPVDSRMAEGELSAGYRSIAAG
jgi:hypothetical protein